MSRLSSVKYQTRLKQLRTLKSLGGHSGTLYVVRVGKNLKLSQNCKSFLIAPFIYLFLLSMQIFALIPPYAICEADWQLISR